MKRKEKKNVKNSMQKLEIKIAKSAEIRRLVTINWRYSITEQQWTAYSDSPTLTRYFMRSVNTNKNEKKFFFFRARTTRYLTFKFHRTARMLWKKIRKRILRATQKWNETYTQTHKRSKNKKRLMKIFLQSRQKFVWIKIRHTILA